MRASGRYAPSDRSPPLEFPEAMHTVMHIDELAPFQYAASFTVHLDLHVIPSK